MKMNELSKKYEDYVIGLRRELHMYPEISYEEKETNLVIKRELDSMNIPYEDVGDGYSLIAEIKCSEEGKSIGVRADIDALPMQELTDCSYKSKIDGVMHACGHDAHIAMLLGTAKVLSEIKDKLKGTIYLCFQSAEEIGKGAEPIINALNKKGGVSEFIGLHIWSLIDSGKIALIDGPVMAGVQSFEVKITGQGGHASRPDLCKDPVKPACDLALKLSSIPGNFYDALDNSVVHVGMVKAGTKSNIFPDDALITGGCRFYKDGGAEKIFSQIKRMAEGTALTYGVEAEVFDISLTPPTINHHEQVMKARKIVEQMDGLELDLEQERLAASDNFGTYLQSYPGFYGLLGAMNKEKGVIWPHHNSKFNLDEDVFVKGVEFFANYVYEFLSK